MRSAKSDEELPRVTALNEAARRRLAAEQMKRSAVEAHEGIHRSDAMTIEKPDVVDLVGVERGTGKIILSMVDNLDWDDCEGHLLTLQAKLNRYIAFVESGEIRETYADSKGRDVVIALLLVFPLSSDDRVVEFVSQVRTILGGIGVEFRVELLPQDSPS